MPFFGLSHFYGNTGGNTGWNTGECQCPTSGLSHFYEELEAAARKQIKSVNALHRAYPISTAKVEKETIRPLSVNALHRAYPISTY